MFIFIFNKRHQPEVTNKLWTMKHLQRQPNIATIKPVTENRGAQRKQGVVVRGAVRSWDRLGGRSRGNRHTLGKRREGVGQLLLVTTVANLTA